ncbi:MAG: biotin--[acetyl-CoA-carboxylase] ligase [SAR202 cluster bacterium]|nr:biotin--[acetyl-CoA-carboxylase] ligase [SAR202 cluster bacterium]
MNKSLDIELVMASCRGQTIGHTLIHYDTLGSTMDEACVRAQKGSPEGTIVVAEEQADGRGRFDRQWISPKGADLLFSIILRPSIQQLPQVNMAAAISVCEIVRNQTGLNAVIKWPNDVRVRGRKISGILVESVVDSGSVDSAVVGFAINVNSDHTKDEQLKSIATSMRIETGNLFDRVRVLVGILQNFNHHYSSVIRGKPLTKLWESQLETIGQHVEVRWKEDVYEGVATGVDEAGNLLLRQPDGSQLVAVAGEVTMQGS